MNHTYRNNPQLKTIIQDAGWKGTPMDKNGRFSNLYYPFIPTVWDVLKWKLKRNPLREKKKAEHWLPEIITDHAWLNGKDDVIVWLGHSTFYIRTGGIRMITDPVFGDILLIKRKTPFPIDPSLLINLDYILLSHDHRDHMDKHSLQLLARNNPNAEYLSGLGTEKLIHDFTHSDKISCAGWYQQYNTRIPITFIPSRHWAKRGAFDTNKRLWGGFVIEASHKRILFGGDSGYDQHYKDLGNLFGSFDYALLGIGAYEPLYFMGPNHQSPTDALKAMEDLHAAHMIPMHYATFDLSDEPLSMPLQELEKMADPHKVIILKHGQALAI